MTRERFDAKIEKTATCWNWIGAKSTPYGMFHYYGRLTQAHRAALLFEGVEIPQGMVVDHICRNKLCVRPDHLRVVTQRQNVFENSEGLAAKNAAKTHCIHGHKLRGDNLRVYNYANGTKRMCLTCNLRNGAEYRERHKAA